MDSLKIEQLKEVVKPVMPAEGGRALKISDIQLSKSIHGWETVIIEFDYKGFKFTQTFANCNDDDKCEEERAMLSKLALDGEIRVGDVVVGTVLHKYSSKHDKAWAMLADVDTVIR